MSKIFIIYIIIYKHIYVFSSIHNWNLKYWNLKFCPSKV